jgi:integrase
MKSEFFDTRLGRKGKCPETLLPEPNKDGKIPPQVDHWDERQAGLGLRVTKYGRRSFFVWYRFNGFARRDTFKPSYPALSISDARKEASITTIEAAAGDDPWNKDRAPRHHIYLKNHPVIIDDTETPKTFAAAVEDYYQRDLVGRKELKTAYDVKRAILKAGEPWANKQVSEISAGEIQRKLEAIRDVGHGRGASPYMANRTHAYMVPFFKWASRPAQGLIDRSPMENMDRPWENEAIRTRADGSKPILNDSELAATWMAADKIGSISGALVKLLILTGKRKGAIAAMRWSEIDEETRLWSPPQSSNRKRGNKRNHPITLPKLAMRIIRGLPRIEGSEWVFPGRKNGSHLDPGTSLKNKVRKNADIDDFTFHFFRHTAKSHLTALGIPPHIHQLVTDHKAYEGAGEAYDHHHYIDEVAKALEALSADIQGILVAKGVRSENVEPLRG